MMDVSSRKRDGLRVCLYFESVGRWKNLRKDEGV